MVQDSFSPMGLFQQDLKKMYMRKGDKGKQWAKNILPALRIRGQAQFNTRYIWKGLPEGIEGQDIERMLYYRGLLMMCYDKEYGFMILPAKQSTKQNDSTISFTGKWHYAQPVPFMGAGEDSSDKKDTPELRHKKLVLATMGAKKVQWQVPFVESEEQAMEALKNNCVLLFDYTPQISQIPMSRESLENPFYEGQVELMGMIRTASLNSTGVQWVRVGTQAEADVMKEQFACYDEMVLNGTRYICISSDTDIQESSTKSTAQMQEFWASWQSLENLRQSCIGLGNDGMLQKSQYQNETEFSLDNIGNNPVLLDGWLQRVKFCTIANAMFGTYIGVEIAGGDTGAGAEESNTESADNGSEGGGSNE